MAQQAFRRHDDQGPLVLHLGLFAQYVKILCGSSQVYHLHVILGAELQKTFQPARGVLRPLSLITVGKGHHQGAFLSPFRLARCDILIHRNLGTVDKIAKLGFPDYQGIQLRRTVAELEAETGKLAEQTVVGIELGLILAEMTQWDILLVGFGAVQLGVTVREGTSFGILTGYPNGNLVFKQRSKGKRFRQSPVDFVLVFFHNFCTLGQLLQQLRVGIKVLRHRVYLHSDILELLHRIGSVGKLWPVLLPDLLPIQQIFSDLQGRSVFGIFESLLKQLVEFLVELLGLIFAQLPFAHQLLAVDLPHGGMVLNLLVQSGLGECGFVTLVVPVLAVANQVDHHILSEFLAIFECQFHGMNGLLRAVAVDVKDGCKNHLGQVGSILGGTAIFRKGGKPDLVVDDDMYGSAGLVGVKLRHIQRFSHHTLAREGRIPVYQDGDDIFLWMLLVVMVLQRPGGALHYGVDRFEVARVGQQLQLDGIAILGLVFSLGAEMIFHITRSLDTVGIKVALKIGKNLAVRFIQQIHQEIQPTPVGHTQEDFFHAGVSRLLQHEIHHRDHGIGPFQ